MQPPCQASVPNERVDEMEAFYPPRASVCRNCFLVHAPSALTPAQIFADDAYFSSYSDSCLEHAREYVSTIVDRLPLTPNSFVIELARNDGYLLRNVVDLAIPCRPRWRGRNRYLRGRGEALRSLVFRPRRHGDLGSPWRPRCRCSSPDPWRASATINQTTAGVWRGRQDHDRDRRRDTIILAC